MGLLLTEDEVMLRDTAEGFFAEKAPVKALRALRDERDETGFDRGLWQEMAQMGFTGVVIEEDHGGVDMGFMATGLIAEQWAAIFRHLRFSRPPFSRRQPCGKAGQMSRNLSGFQKLLAVKL